MNYFSKFSFLGKQHIKDILEDVSDITDNWENLGIALGLHDTTLTKIKKECGGKVDECKRHIITAWIDQQDMVQKACPPSWKGLAAAIRGKLVNNYRLAGEIAVKHNVIGFDRSQSISYT